MKKWLENLFINFKCTCGKTVKPIDNNGGYKCTGCGKEYNFSS